MSAATFASSVVETEAIVLSRTYADGSGELLELRGTLTLPPDAESSARCPAVLLLGGTGGDTRDGEPAPTDGVAPPRRALLRRIAEHLALHGTATLRMDKRGCGASEGDASTSDYETDLVDNLAAFDWVRSHGSINPDAVGVAGHSAGAFNACLIARDRPNEMRAVGLLGALYEPIDDLVRRNWPRIAQLWASLDNDRRGWLLAHRPRDVVASFGTEQFIDAAHRRQDDVVLSAHGLTFDYSTVRFRQDLERPVADEFDHVHMEALILHGANDLNVDVNDALSTFTRLQARGNNQVTLHVLPGLDHSFQHTPQELTERVWQRVASTSYANVVSIDALNAISTWAAGVLPR